MPPKAFKPKLSTECVDSSAVKSEGAEPSSNVKSQQKSRNREGNRAKTSRDGNEGKSGRGGGFVDRHAKSTSIPSAILTGGSASVRHKKEITFSETNDERSDLGQSSSSSSTRPPNVPAPVPVGSARKTGRRASGAIGKLYAPLSFDIEESDSDNNEADDTMDIEGQDEKEKEEAWPPKYSGSYVPLSLPTGPRSKQKRKQLNKKDLISISTDDHAKKKQEEEFILMQMPSALSLKFGSSSEKSNKEVENRNLKVGKIGKIEVRKSGRVFLVTEDGDRHECHAGTAAYFSQYVASLSLATGDHLVKAPPNDTSSVNNSPNRNSENSLHLLGPVSRKWVVTGPAV